MLYTHLGRIVAVLLLLLGILLIVTGLGIANEWLLRMKPHWRAMRHGRGQQVRLSPGARITSSLPSDWVS
jgi:hypothetical protein